MAARRIRDPDAKNARLESSAPRTMVVGGFNRAQANSSIRYGFGK
jgi:hypothetical protein